MRCVVILERGAEFFLACGPDLPGGGTSGVEIRELESRNFGVVRRVARETWAGAYVGIIPENVQR